MPYFRMVATTLSSAMKRFTVLFDMGRSGTASLLSPSNSFLLFDLVFYSFLMNFNWVVKALVFNFKIRPLMFAPTEQFYLMYAGVS